MTSTGGSFTSNRSPLRERESRGGSGLLCRDNYILFSEPLVVWLRITSWRDHRGMAVVVHEQLHAGERTTILLLSEIDSH